MALQQRPALDHYRRRAWLHGDFRLDSRHPLNIGLVFATQVGRQPGGTDWNYSPASRRDDDCTRTNVTRQPAKHPKLPAWTLLFKGAGNGSQTVTGSNTQRPDAFSMSVWAYSIGWENQTKAICGWGTGVGSDGTELYVRNTGLADARVRSGGGAGERIRPATIPVTLNHWHHLCMTQTTVTALPDIYIDGALANGAPDSSGVTTADFGNKRIGTGPVNSLANLYWNGQISDVRMWSRTLTAAEVLALYNEPWCHVAPINPPIAQFGPVTLPVWSTMHAHTVTQPGTPPIVPNSTIHAHTVTQPSLAQPILDSDVLCPHVYGYDSSPRVTGKC